MVGGCRSLSDPALLDELWRTWARIGAGLTDDDWRTGTRLAGWTVAELYAHVARGVGVLRNLVANPLSRPVDRECAAEYFASFRPRAREGAALVDQAARAAASLGRTAVVAQLVDDGPVVLAEARAAGPVVVDTVAGAMRLADYLVTRVVEATVHLVDLHAAVPAVPLPGDEALYRVADVLVEMAGPVSFIDIATGRATGSPFPVFT